MVKLAESFAVEEEMVQKALGRVFLWQWFSISTFTESCITVWKESLMHRLLIKKCSK